VSNVDVATPETRTPLARFLGPVTSLRRLWLAITPATLLAVSATLHVHPASDMYWSLASGQWMLHHGVMTSDHLSYTIPGHHIISMEWGYDLILAVSAKLFSAPGLLLLVSFIVAATMLATALYLRGLGASAGRIGWILVFFGLFCVPQFSQQRALGLSIALLATQLVILQKARANPRWLVALVPLMALWVNVHGSVLLGLLIIVVELVWALLPTSLLPAITNRSPYPKALVFGSVAALLACFITPWGPYLLVYDAKLSLSPELNYFVIEWMSPNFHNPLYLLIFALPLILLARLMWRRSARALETTMLVIMLMGTAHSERLVEYLLLFSAGLTAVEFRGLYSGDPRSFMSTGPARVGVIGVVLVSAVLWLAPLRGATPTPDIPVSAMAHVQTLSPGRLFTEFSWASYGVSQGLESFMDGRLDVFIPSGIFSDYVSISNLQVPPDPLLTRYHVRYVLWPRYQALSTYLASDPQWRSIYTNKQDVLFERDSPVPRRYDGRIPGFVPDGFLSH
jgi:hypothetical protein